ncbi:MAG: hypothetical protein GF398_03355 [Chitinivibrionales bacterium]|nr:hypothetical protein [Chitinivibrionales bacterium]
MIVSPSNAPKLFVLTIVLSCTTWVSALPNARIADPAAVQEFFETRAVKVAFTDLDHKLYFVDFSTQAPGIHAMLNTPACSNLAMSPDGNWIAYQTGSLTDGRSDAESTAWIIETRENAMPIQISEADAGFTPRFLQSAQQLTVVWASCGANPEPGKRAWDGCGAMLQRTIAGGVMGPIDTLYAGGSYFGGASYDGLYLSSAQYATNGHIKDLSAPLLPPVHYHNLTCDNQTGVDTTVSLQVCNPSTSQSQRYQNLAMYLDFGFYEGNFGVSSCQPDFGDWGFHQIIFLANANGDIVTGYRIDSVEATTDTGVVTNSEWAHSEWSTHPYFGVAVEYINRKWKHDRFDFLQNFKEIEHVSAIDLKDSLYLRLVSTNDTLKDNRGGFHFGALWVEVPAGFQEECWLTEDGEPCTPMSNRVIDQIGIGTQAVQLNLVANRIVASQPLTSVAVYGLDGALYRRFKSSGAVTFYLGGSAPVPNGTLVVNAQLRNGSRLTTRLLNSL